MSADPDSEFEEGCPDCGSDTVVSDDDGDHCAMCGWRP
jgi:hypothetical protein